MRAILTAATAATIAIAVPASAITFDITGTVVNGIYAGETGTGFITWDNDLLSGVGDERIGPVGTTAADYEDPTLAISFDIGGTIFAEFNDVNFPDFPTFDFFDGELNFIDYVVVDGVSGADLLPYGVLEGYFTDLTFDQGQYFVDIVLEYEDTPAVPLPAGLPLLVGALGLLGVVRRRQG